MSESYKAGEKTVIFLPQTLPKKIKELRTLLDSFAPNKNEHNRIVVNKLTHEVLPLIRKMSGEITKTDSLSNLLKKLIALFEFYFRKFHLADYYSDDRKKTLYVLNLANEIQQLFFRLTHSEGLAIPYELEKTGPVNEALNNNDLLSNIVAMMPKDYRKFALVNKKFFKVADEIVSLTAVWKNPLPWGYQKFKLWESLLEDPKDETVSKYLESTYGLKIDLKDYDVFTFLDYSTPCSFFSMAQDLKKLYPEKIVLPFTGPNQWVRSYIYKKLTEFIPACIEYEMKLVQRLFYNIYSNNDTLEKFPPLSEDLNNQYSNLTLEGPQNIWKSPLGQCVSGKFLLSKGLITNDILATHEVFSVHRKNLIADFFSNDGAAVCENDLSEPEIDKLSPKI